MTDIRMFDRLAWNGGMAVAFNYLGGQTAKDWITTLSPFWAVSGRVEIGR